ncbi:hypothetical protein GCM10023187_43010 [Nibrella viscosa]|uniref:Uncharacterized protein n=1 Tax=Nibrella viscosa TaxID=1084524 RepID=A0ABP8KSP9_9BACT
MYVTGAIYSVDGGITISKKPVGEKADTHLNKEPTDELDLEHAIDGHTSIRR